MVYGSIRQMPLTDFVENEFWKKISTSKYATLVPESSCEESLDNGHVNVKLQNNLASQSKLNAFEQYA